MRLLVFILLPLLGMANELVLSGPPNARPGQAITASVTFSSTSTAPAGMQWTLAVPVGVTAQVTAGPVLAGAGKELYCSQDSGICLVVGMNTAAVPVGAVAQIAVQVPLATPSGRYELSLTDLLGATAIGDLVALNSAAYSFLVLAKSDLNGDGVTNKVDLELMIDQVLGRRPCTDDQNGDGKCNLIDVLAVIRGALD